MPKKIYFRGAGLVTAIGNSVAENLDAIDRKRYRPSTATIRLASAEIQLPYFTINGEDIPPGTDRMHDIIDRTIAQALDAAGLTAEQLQRAGLFVGSTSFDMYACEMALKSAPCSDEGIAENVPPFNRLTRYIQQRFALAGPVYTFNTACTSSANALIYAAEFIRRGDIDHALVVGIEFYNEVTALGFSSLELISRQGMRPFDKERDGLWLGEGCGALVVSAEPVENGFAYIAGANLGDNFSITASNPEGGSVQTVITRALASAGIDASAIAIIKTHGTASLSNDEAEAAGMGRVFGERMPPVVALKPFIGHTLGACGINELILFYHALQRGSVITFPCRVSDEFPLRLAANSDIAGRGYYLLNYFGFGGNSTALVIGNA